MSNTNRDTIDMSREAGWPIEAGNELPDTGSMCLKAFEALVRADERSVEREACAKVCDWYVDYSSNPMNFAENCAQEIRARGNT